MSYGVSHSLFIALSYLFHFCRKDCCMMLSTYTWKGNFVYLDQPISCPGSTPWPYKVREFNSLLRYRVRRDGVMREEMLTGDNVPHARSCGRDSMMHLSQHCGVNEKWQITPQQPLRFAHASHSLLFLSHMLFKTTHSSPSIKLTWWNQSMFVATSLHKMHVKKKFFFL